MDNFIKNLEIKNFKSIKHLTLDCKRVNVFIGKPNVGKSNILEALGLLGVYFTDNNAGLSKNMFRYEHIANLFYDNNPSNPVEVKTNIGSGFLRLFLENEKYNILAGPENFINQNWEENLSAEKIMELFSNTKSDTPFIRPTKITFDAKGKIWNNELFFSIHGLNIQRYLFKQLEEYNSIGAEYLISPIGENLVDIIYRNKVLAKEIAGIFAAYGFNIVLSQSPGKFLVQKKQDDIFTIQYPYSSIADTFQRFIFYLAAIESNSDSVLIFEEPEVHSFPPYVKELAERIAYKKENQFFISTHSPYLLNTLISRLDASELNVFLTSYKDYQTFVKPLSEESIQEVRDLGVDVFFNLDRF